MVRAAHAAVDAFDASLVDLDAEADPRRAIIAAYARLLAGFERGGLGRRPHEAPVEHLRRALTAVAVRPAPVERLVGLFVEARFSHHDLGPVDKQAAIDAFVAARRRPARPPGDPAVSGAARSAIAVGGGDRAGDRWPTPPAGGRRCGSSCSCWRWRWPSPSCGAAIADRPRPRRPPSSRRPDTPISRPAGRPRAPGRRCRRHGLAHGAPARARRAALGGPGHRRPAARRSPGDRSRRPRPGARGRAALGTELWAALRNEPTTMTVDELVDALERL